MKIKFNKFLVFCIVSVNLFLSVSALKTYAATHSYQSKKYAGLTVNYIEIDMNNKNIKPVVITSGNNLTSTNSISNLAKSYKAFAAINGTYFDAYQNNKYPVPYGAIIKDGKLLHTSTGYPVFGIKKDGKMIIDRLSFRLSGAINSKKDSSLPWRMNHPTNSQEKDSITLYTSDYGKKIDVIKGAKAVIIKDGLVEKILTTSFDVPKNSFAILYNPNVAHLVDERFQIGDTFELTQTIKTQFTKEEDWIDVKQALGAGPSLIINGKITADGASEGFTEAKININSSSRSFIGNTADGKIIIGNFPSATLKQAAKACQSMKLINAMCLDGGGSVALYYNGVVKTQGRNINNALGFVISK